MSPSSECSAGYAVTALQNIDTRFCAKTRRRPIPAELEPVEEEKRLARSYTSNAEAYEDYLRGRYLWNKRTKEGMNKGIEYFQQAIRQGSELRAGI